MTTPTTCPAGTLPAYRAHGNPAETRLIIVSRDGQPVVAQVGPGVDRFIETVPLAADTTITAAPGITVECLDPATLEPVASVAADLTGADLDPALEQAAPVATTATADVLPVTGAPVGLEVLLAAVITVAGAAAILTARRRTRPAGAR